MTQVEVIGQSNFEELMAQGVEAQHRGEHAEALERRREAFWAAIDNIQAARALRDSASSHIKLGQLPLALEANNRSVQLLTGGEYPRELASSQAQAGQLHYMGDILYPPGTQAYLHTAAAHRFDTANTTLRGLEEISEAPKRFRIDQYRINMAARRAVAEATSDNTHRKLRAMGLAGRAACLAVRSESPKIETSNKSLAFKDRYKTKLRHLSKAVVAFGVAALYTKHSNLLRKGALSLAEKVMR